MVVFQQIHSKCWVKLIRVTILAKNYKTLTSHTSMLFSDKVLLVVKKERKK